MRVCVCRLKTEPMQRRSVRLETDLGDGQRWPSNILELITKWERQTDSNLDFVIRGALFEFRPQNVGVYPIPNDRPNRMGQTPKPTACISIAFKLIPFQWFLHSLFAYCNRANEKANPRTGGRGHGCHRETETVKRNCFVSEELRFTSATYHFLWDSFPFKCALRQVIY